MCNNSFAHLHNHSKFSLLDGIITPELLLPRLAKLGMTSFALTDHGCMGGIPEFAKACGDAGVKLIAGCEMYEVDDIRLKTAEEAQDQESMECESVTKSKEREEGVDVYHKRNPRYWHITLLARNPVGYQKLTRLTAAAATADAYYYKPRIDASMLATIAAGDDIIVGLGCALSRLSQYCLQYDDYQGWSDRADRYLKLFGENNVFCEIMANSYEGQGIINEKTLVWANQKGLPIVPTNDCHYVERDHARLQDILLCIATNQRADAEDRKFKFEGDSYYIRSKDEMQDAFLHSYGIEIAPYLSNSIHFAERCEHAGYIDQKEFRLPRFQIPQGREWEEFKAWIRAKEDRKRERYGDELINKVLNS